MSDAEFLTHAARLYPARSAQLVSTLTRYLFSDLRPQVDPTISEELPGTIHGIFDNLHIKELPIEAGTHTLTLPIRRKVVGVQTEGTGDRRNTITTAAIFSDGSGLLVQRTLDERTQKVVTTTQQAEGKVLIGDKEIPLSIALGDFIARTADFHYGTDYTKWLHSRAARS